jgi:hypothetical protein
LVAGIDGFACAGVAEAPVDDGAELVGALAGFVGLEGEGWGEGGAGGGREAVMGRLCGDDAGGTGVADGDEGAVDGLLKSFLEVRLYCCGGGRTGILWGRVGWAFWARLCGVGGGAACIGRRRIWGPSSWRVCRDEKASCIMSGWRWRFWRYFRELCCGWRRWCGERCAILCGE